MESELSPKLRLQQALGSILQLDEQEARDIVDEGTAGCFRKFKVTELKDVIKSLKNSGYNQTNLNTYANKPELIQMLVDVANCEGTVQHAAPPAPAVIPALPAAAVIPVVAAQNPALPRPHNLNQVLTARAGLVVAGPSSPPPHPQTAVKQKFQDPFAPLSSAKKNKHKHKHAPPLPPSLSGNNNSSSSSTAGMGGTPHPGLNSVHKVQAYRMLKQVEGIAEAEILAELSLLSPTEAIDEDMILFNIVAKRTVSLRFVFVIFFLLLQF